jgi:hypothetical protein
MLQKIERKRHENGKNSKNTRKSAQKAKSIITRTQIIYSAQSVKEKRAIQIKKKVGG